MPTRSAPAIIAILLMSGLAAVPLVHAQSAPAPTPTLESLALPSSSRFT